MKSVHTKVAIAMVVIAASLVFAVEYIHFHSFPNPPALSDRTEKAIRLSIRLCGQFLVPIALALCLSTWLNDASGLNSHYCVALLHSSRHNALADLRGFGRAFGMVSPADALQSYRRFTCVGNEGRMPTVYDRYSSIRVRESPRSYLLLTNGWYTRKFWWVGWPVLDSRAR
jgi:hypothetical protein